MGLVQCVVIVSMMCAQLVLTSPQTDGTLYYMEGGRKCQMCPAGKYRASCTECLSCPVGYYTTELNREDSCHPCYGDCRSELNLKVVQNCTSTSNVKCVCEDGYKCSEEVKSPAICRYCVKIQQKSTTEAAVDTSGKDKHIPSSASSGHNSTSVQPCRFPKCGSRSVPPAQNGTHLTGDKSNSHLAAILCPLVAVGCVAVMILFFVRCSPGDESCFKQAIAKLYCEGGKDASHKPNETTHQLPKDSFSTKQQQQPSCLSAANLGPVHVHNPGTVIFSLLSQFTGQVGPTTQCGKTAEKVIGEDDDERDCPVFHPTSSPSIHLSEEERSGDIDSIFFPSQEQGKDCHMSKEEAL